MYAAIRRYQIDPDKAPEVIQRIMEDFVPEIRKSPGILGYYVLDAGDGRFATISVFEGEAEAEASNRMASEWIKRFLASRILEQDRICGLFVEVEETLQGPFYEGVPNTTNNRHPPRLLSVREVCERLRMGKSWVYQRINSGELPSVKLGGSRKVRLDDLEEYLTSRTSHTKEEEEG